MTVRPSGEQHELAADGYTAVVTEVGAALRVLAHDGRDLVLPWSAEEMMPGHRGALLAPWPNRVVDGRYRDPDGREQLLALSEPKRGHAIHGLVDWAPWWLVAHTEDSVVLGARVFPRSGYPYVLDVTVAYALGPDGLSTTVRATNVGAGRAPYGCGAHPYVLAGPARPGAVDDWTLALPATRVLEVTEDRLVPTGLAEVDGTGYDFRSPRRIGDTFLDHAFTGVLRDDTGRATVRVTGDDGSGVEVRFGSECPWVQVHTADKPGAASHRAGLAVEPMTCPPDAYNSGTDLVVLEPGQTHQASWTIAAV